MYQPQWINRLVQFGQVSYTLILTDDADILPPFRNEISLSADQDTPQVLADIVTRQIEIALTPVVSPAPVSDPIAEANILKGQLAATITSLSRLDILTRLLSGL